MTWGSTLIVDQAMEWHITVDKSATSMNYGILLQGIGGLIAIPLIEAYGRLPLWLWPQVITTFMVLGATLSKNYDTFTTFRSLQGVFGTVPQVVGLPIIHDMYDPKGVCSIPSIVSRC
jgi:MFS family permease